MSWKKCLLGIGLTLLCLLVPQITVLAASNANVEQLTQQRLADAQKINEACLQCHGQKSTNGQAPYVDAAKYKESTHGVLACTGCHTNLTVDGKNCKATDSRALAKEVDNSCQSCHEAVAKEYAQSIHGKLALQGKDTALCSDCHGSHNIRKASDPESTVYGANSIETCSKCHDHKYQETYEESFHGRAVSLGSTTAATCISCHGSHNILPASDPASTVNKNNVAQTCAKCHLKARPNFANGTEHAELKAQGPGATTYWTLKFFTWLTIIVVALLLIHIEMELWRRFHDVGQKH